MSLPRAVAPVPAPAGAPPLQHRAQDPATPVGTGDVGRCPCTEPDPPTSCGTHSCQTSSTIHSNASTCPRPACTLPARTTAPLCTANAANAVAAPGPLRPGLPALDTDTDTTAPAASLRPPCTAWAPSTPERGAQSLPGTGHRRDTVAPNPRLDRGAMPQAARCTRPCHRQHRGPIPAHRGIALLPDQPGPTDVSTRVRGPTAVPVPRRKRPSHAPAPLRPMLAPCLPPALPTTLPARHRHSFRQEPDSQHPCPVPARQAAPAGRSRQEHPAAAAGSGRGDNQHWPGRGRHVRRRAPVRLCASQAGRAGPGRAGWPLPSPREALPFRTEKGYCMTRDGDASRPAAAPAPSCAARSERPGT